MSSAHCAVMNDTIKVTMTSVVHVCVSCALFFRHSSESCQTDGCIQREPVISERPEGASQQMMPKALPRHARDSPVASFTKLSYVS